MANTLRLYVDGELAQVTADEVFFSLPLIDGTPDPTAPCHRVNHHIGVTLPLSTIADSGVPLPEPGEWTSFELTAELEIEDHVLSVTEPSTSEWESRSVRSHR